MLLGVDFISCFLLPGMMFDSKFYYLGWKRERGLVFLVLFVVTVRRTFLFLWVLGKVCVILFWHSLGLPYKYFERHLANRTTNTECYVRGLPVLHP